MNKNRANSYALFARLFRQEISRELLNQLRRQAGQSSAADAGGEGRLIMNQFLSDVAAFGEDQALADLAADYASLFLNAGCRPAHPYESVYTSPDRLLMQEAWDHVRRVYAAAGLIRSGGFREPEDHISLEMEFMSRLCSLVVAAIEQGDAEEARVHLQTQRKFLEDHLLVWAPRFCEDVTRNAATDFYRGLGCLVRDFLVFEKELLDSESGSG